MSRIRELMEKRDFWICVLAVLVFIVSLVIKKIWGPDVLRIVAYLLGIAGLIFSIGYVTSLFPKKNRRNSNECKDKDTDITT